MTDKDKKISVEDEMKAIEIENASYIDVEPEKVVSTPKRSNASDTPKASDKSKADAKPAKTKLDAEQKSAKTGALWFVSILNFLLAVLIIAAAYWGWMQWNKTQSEQQTFFADQEKYFAEQEMTLSSKLNEIKSQNESNDSLRDDMDSQTSALSSSVEDLERSLDEAKNQLSQTQQQLMGNQKKLAEVSGRRPSDWLLAEADYLVRMAGRKLWLEQDVKTAVLMLQSADSRLQDLDEPSLLPIRQDLANDIQTLQQINQVPLTSIALALSGMIQQVENLPLSLPEVKEDGPATADLTGFERVLRELTDNFKYQSNDKPIKPMLDQQQQWLAREQLRYSMLLAQSAVLKGEAGLLEQSIKQSIGLLKQHYDLEEAVVTQFIDSLESIGQTNIARTYPEEFQAAQPLKDLMETRLDSALSNGKLDL